MFGSRGDPWDSVLAFRSVDIVSGHGREYGHVNGMYKEGSCVCSPGDPQVVQVLSGGRTEDGL